MFTEELIFLDLDARNSREVLEYSFTQLQKLNYVSDSYLESILNREKEFPTGLVTKVGINIAMPHTETHFAKQEGIVFIRTKDEVEFQHMVDPEETVETRLIFNIVVKHPNHQVVFLTKLMELFQNRSLLTRLLEEENSSSIVELLNAFVNKK